VLEFLGRADEQLKIRGYRIEPGEIEAALASHPDVASAAVVTARDASGDRYLSAFVTPAAAASDNLRELLRARLPDYMVPGTIAGVDALPLTWNGKVDRRALAARACTGSSQSSAVESPRGHVEELLAALWCDVLHVEKIGRHDSFFDLGGHSLVATRLVARIRKAFAADLPLKAIFEAPTIAALASRLSRAAADRTGPIERRPAGTPPALSSAQRRLWFLDELTPGSAAYLVPAVVDIEGLQRGTGCHNSGRRRTPIRCLRSVGPYRTRPLMRGGSSRG
jgi:acyl carrier protein